MGGGSKKAAGVKKRAAGHAGGKEGSILNKKAFQNREAYKIPKYNPRKAETSKGSREHSKSR